MGCLIKLIEIMDCVNMSVNLLSSLQLTKFQLRISMHERNISYFICVLVLAVRRVVANSSLAQSLKGKASAGT